MRGSRWLPVAIAGAGIVVLASPARADDALVGEFALKGDEGFLVGSSSKLQTKLTADVKLTVTKHADGKYTVTREVKTSDGRTERWDGSGWVQNGRLYVRFTLASGLADAIGGASSEPVRIAAVYSIQHDGSAWGSLRNAKQVGGWEWAREEGKRVASSTPTTPTTPTTPPVTPPTSVRIVKPAAGSVFVAGQVVDVVTDPPGSALDVVNGRIDAGNKLVFTTPGEVEIRAVGTSVRVRAVPLEVTEITVLDAIPLDDAPAPQVQRDLGAATAKKSDPAAIFQAKPLHLALTLAARENPSEPAKLTLAAHDTAVGSTLAFQGCDFTLTDAVAGQRIEIASVGPLSNKVAVNALGLQFEASGAAVGSPIDLRVYTTHKTPIKNIVNDRLSPTTKLHFELACTWANGASQNVGNGDDSIGWNVDNRFRHHVHPVDYKQGVKPAVLPYALDSKPPLNYADLPSSWAAKSSGLDRGISSIYYPPLEPKKPYEQYTNYAGNFGWWVLDNPSYTGGRCNQQASCISSILGTLGIKAEVHYLERTGFGKTSGRPVRQYWYTAGFKSGPWNFHGLCMATMDDGTEWLYDGSFSSPPNRKNGLRQWAESVGMDKPFIGEWADWYYEDVGGIVPEDDRPDHWDGVQ